MKIRLFNLQDDDKVVKKLRSKKLPKGWEDIEEVLYYQGLLYVLKDISLELISKHHNNPLEGHFGIEKTGELIAKKYYWPTLQRDVKTYVKGCDVYLASKTVYHKPYEDL